MQATRDFSHYLKSAGAGLLHLDLAVEGISCAGCMARIERNLSTIPDVTSARVNLTDRRLALEWKAGAIDPAVFVDRLAELGYKAYPFERASAESQEVERTNSLLRRLAVAAFAAMNVMMLSVPVWSGNAGDMLPEQRDFFHWLSALIVLPAAPIPRSHSSSPRLPRCARAASIWMCRSRSASSLRSACRWSKPLPTPSMPTSTPPSC